MNLPITITQDDLLEILLNVDLSKYIALMIDKLNYDHSISELLDPNAKIQNSLAYYRKYHK